MQTVAKTWSIRRMPIAVSTLPGHVELESSTPKGAIKVLAIKAIVSIVINNTQLFTGQANRFAHWSLHRPQPSSTAIGVQRLL
jgi:hypothetical protein